ncbi:RHS repeat-associated core domain-containing protein, partial [Acetivibrio sp. MSJd-27]|uniref:RHS repeat-associated core domain-containing protein n=1 Tax=Acetivibrio sp. MSJd-27 TaxID=2841523 RepID=UPI001C10B356
PISRTVNGGSKEYYSFNTHGDTAQLVNASGTILKDYTYDAFGNQKQTEEIDNNPFRYCGEYFDNETGFIYLRARYYDSSIGRFTTEDPIKDGVNWFVYCGNNPVMFIDPLGLTITLTGTDEEKQKSFNQLQMLTNDELYMDPETGIVTIISKGTMNTDKMLTAGSKMVSDLIANDNFDCQIQREYVNNDGCYVDYIDDGAIVRMNDWAEEGGNWFYEVSDGKGGVTSDDHKAVAHIVLGHELIHATHHMNGTLADPSRTVYHNTNNGLIADIRYDNNGNRLNISEEYNTVGLYHIVGYPNPVGSSMIYRFYIPWPNSLTENTLRAEQGLNKRIAY